MRKGGTHWLVSFLTGCRRLSSLRGAAELVTRPTISRWDSRWNEGNPEGKQRIAGNPSGLLSQVGRLLSARGTKASHQAAIETEAGRDAEPETEAWRRLYKGQLNEAIEALDCLVEQRCEISAHLFFHVLKGCIAHKDLVLGTRVHSLLAKSGFEANTFLANHVIRMYASHGRLQEAMHVFMQMTEPSGYMWVSIILAHTEHGQPLQAVRLYKQMRESNVKLDSYMAVAVLKACTSAADLAAGKQVHADLLQSGVEPNKFVGNCLVNMYAKCGRLEDARTVFDGLAAKDGMTWTAMISSYAQRGLGQESLALYARMQQESLSPADDVMFACLLKACASVGALDEGKELHSRIRERGFDDNPVVGSSLVDMYAKCGNLEDARKVFDCLQSKDVVTWNAMLSAYAQNGLPQESLSLYVQMQQEGMPVADYVTFVCLLKACSSIGALHQGKHLHSKIQDEGLEALTVVGSSLVDMYAKCGSLDDANRVFDRLPSKDAVTWTTMIAGYAHHGLGQEALQCYERMQQTGIQPDDVTFLSLLSACSHAGLIDKGIQYFKSMSRDYGLTPALEHYVSMVDLFGRAGCFGMVEDLLSAMPVEPDLALWLCLLGACRKHGNVVLGERAFESAVHLQPTNAAPYVLMSHIYADAGLLDSALEVHALRQKDSAWKKPGQSWIEHEQEVHSFLVGDCQHAEYKELYALLDKVGLLLEQEGYNSSIIF